MENVFSFLLILKFYLLLLLLKEWSIIYVSLLGLGTIFAILQTTSPDEWFQYLITQNNA